MGSEASAPNGDRRATYLSVVTQLLVDDLQTLVDAWAPDQDNYRNTFVGIDPREALRRMLTGMGVLSNGELAGQRMDVAMDTRDPEDEHSCFSDNTHRDIVNDAKGVQNVYLGRYGSNSGPGISALISQLDPTLDKSLRKELQTSVADAEDIPAPFDQAINEEDGRAKIQHTIDALREQSRSIVATAKLLEIDSLTTDIH